MLLRSIVNAEHQAFRLWSGHALATKEDILNSLPLDVTALEAHALIERLAAFTAD